MCLYDTNCIFVITSFSPLIWLKKLLKINYIPDKCIKTDILKVNALLMQVL